MNIGQESRKKDELDKLGMDAARMHEPARAKKGPQGA
jgi:hypothetical protein